MAIATDQLFSQPEFEAYTRNYYPSFYCMNPKESLPKCWSSKDKANILQLSELNLTVSYRESSGNGDNESGTVRGNVPIPFICGVYYFEVNVVSKGRLGHIGVGVASKTANLGKLPGWEAASYGYHGDDGNIFHESGTGMKYGPQYTEGDTIGCGVDFLSSSIFFTKNGIFLGNAFEGPLNTTPLFPCVGLQSSSEKVTANFGQKPFKFQFDKYIERTREDYLHVARSVHCGDDLAHVKMKSLVASYLVHHGYASTAEAFARWSGRNIAEDVESIRVRREIQTLILDGRLEDAISRIEAHCPAVFKDNAELRFQLKCQQFIEMVHEQFSNGHKSVDTVYGGSTSSPPQSSSGASRSQARGGPPSSTGDSSHSSASNSPFSRLGHTEHAPSPSSLTPIQIKAQHQHQVGIDGPLGLRYSELLVENSVTSPVVLDDVEMVMVDPTLDGHLDTAKNGHDMDMEVTSPVDGEQCMDGLQQLIEFGRQLNRMASDLKKERPLSEETANLLRNAFSLVAYKDPLKSPLRQLLDAKNKEHTANTVNSAILVAQNLPRRPIIERAIQQMDECMGLSMCGNMGLVGFIHPRVLLSDS